MRTVPVLILGAGALLQFFSGFASAATCNSVDYSCSTPATQIRDPSKDTTTCTSDMTNCDDTDCCMARTLTCSDGYLCTTQGNILDPANSAVVCTNDCDDAQCCTAGTDTCTTTSYTCAGLGQSRDSNLDSTICTNAVCTDAQCCGVDTRCEHYPGCSAATMVLDPDEILTSCAGGANGFCDDATCCKTTCASGNYACTAGLRDDDATCLVGGCADNECCTSPVTCAVEVHSCPDGYHRVGANMCLGAGECTDADCCEADLVSTISEARQKKVPRSRQHLHQYGTM